LPSASRSLSLRSALLDGPQAERDEAIRVALDHLERFGTRGSRAEPAWWLFEGYTKVDCCLATGRLVLFIEGKRTEALVRNLEAIGEVANGRACGVLLIGEELIPELDDKIYEESLPHLTDGERLAVRRRYLGQTTWSLVCDPVGIPLHELTDEL
jgi:hypothetical protein